MKNKINSAITALFLLLIFGFGIAFWVVPDEDFSPEENRALQTFPALTTDGWLDGKVSSRMTSYYSDQFPLRKLWVSMHALGELGLGRGESNGVLLGSNGRLAVRRFDAYVSLTERLNDTDFYDSAHIQKGLDAVSALNEALSAQSIPLCVLIAPRAIDVTVGDFAYPSDMTDRLDTAIRQALAEAGVNSVELLDTFREMHERGEDIYYRTDHHWTTLGAYTAYTAVMKAWGMADEILPADIFTIRSVPDFYGTTHARSGMLFLPPDTLEIWETADSRYADSRYTVTDDGGRAVIESGFISEKYLTGKDKYGAFLDGTHSVLFITDTEAAARGESRPRLLLARDSFASSMAPFLARHFDICLVNLTGGQTNLTELCAKHDCQRVLIVCNRENLITSDCLRNVK